MSTSQASAPKIDKINPTMFQILNKSKEELDQLSPESLTETWRDHFSKKVMKAYHEFKACQLHN